MDRTIFLLRFLFLVTFARAATDNRTCWFPSGVEAPHQYLPCDANYGSHIHCCASGEACLTQGLCYGSLLNLAYRGGCTDRTFNDRHCPQVCLTESADTWSNIYMCTQGNLQGSAWCESNTNTSDACATDTFDWPQGGLKAIAGDAVPTATADSSGSPVTQASTASTTSSPSSSSSASNSSTSATVDDDRVSKSVPVGVGIGVGVPLAIIAAIFGGLYIRERKLRKEAEAMLLAPNSGTSDPKIRPSDNSMLTSPSSYQSYGGSQQWGGPHQAYSQPQQYAAPSQPYAASLQPHANSQPYVSPQPTTDVQQLGGAQIHEMSGTPKK